MDVTGAMCPEILASGDQSRLEGDWKVLTVAVLFCSQSIQDNWCITYNKLCRMARHRCVIQRCNGAFDASSMPH